MAAIASVFTIRRAAQILGRAEELLWDLLDNLEPEDGLIWVYDIDGETPAFTEFGIETLRELIREFVDKRVGGPPAKAFTPRPSPYDCPAVAVVPALVCRPGTQCEISICTVFIVLSH